MRGELKACTLARADVRRHFRPTAGWLALAGLALACSDAQGPSQPPITPAAFIVSNPVQPLEPAVTGGSAGATVEPTVVYISLPPGTIPSGTTATIRDLRTGGSVTAQLVDGGFDPVALPAVEGDTIAIDIQRIGFARLLSFRVTTVARRRPSVVRTSPTPHKRDVALNSIMVIVFSEPLDSTTVNPESVKLWRGTTPVAGTVRFADAAHLRAEFHPDNLLDARTAYQLVVTTAVADVNGLALDSTITVPFTTGATAPPTNLVFASVSTGFYHTCGVTTGGDAYCWGNNETGALGDGTAASSITPVRVTGGLTFAMLSAGDSHTCGVTTAGAAYCWGGQFGLLFGDGGTTVQSTPVAIALGRTWAAVSAGDYYDCGVTTTGAAYCWGDGTLGQLGADLASGTIPVGSIMGVAVAGGLTFAEVSAGDVVSCGITTSAAAYCWGKNDLGGLGIGSSTGPEDCPVYQGGLPRDSNTIHLPCSHTPVAVTGGLKFSTVSAMSNGACGLTETGDAYCWGPNWNGELGNGTTTGPETCWVYPCGTLPTAVTGGVTFTALDAGYVRACGLTATGAAYCWGDGQIGDGIIRNYLAPVPIAGGLTFAMVSPGSFHTCGVTTAGAAYCWGTNNYGQLGNGTTTGSAVPVKVAGQR
jgi:alpha-tubulin suppressor-like RCC1 family protein